MKGCKINYFVDFLAGKCLVSRPTITASIKEVIDLPLADFHCDKNWEMFPAYTDPPNSEPKNETLVRTTTVNPIITSDSTQTDSISLNTVENHMNQSDKMKVSTTSKVQTMGIEITTTDNPVEKESTTSLPISPTSQAIISTSSLDQTSKLVPAQETSTSQNISDDRFLSSTEVYLSTTNLKGGSTALAGDETGADALESTTSTALGEVTTTVLMEESTIVAEGEGITTESATTALIEASTVVPEGEGITTESVEAVVGDSSSSRVKRSVNAHPVTVLPSVESLNLTQGQYAEFYTSKQEEGTFIMRLIIRGELHKKCSYIVTKLSLYKVFTYRLYRLLYKLSVLIMDFANYGQGVNRQNRSYFAAFSVEIFFDSSHLKYCIERYNFVVLKKLILISIGEGFS